MTLLFMFIYNNIKDKYMSEQYKQYLNELSKKADNGNVQAAQELLNEANKWSAKVKEMKEKDKRNE